MLPPRLHFLSFLLVTYLCHFWQLISEIVSAIEGL